VPNIITIRCPHGMHKVNGRCVPIVIDIPRCPPRTHRVRGRCVLNVITIRCPRGMHKVRGRCVPVRKGGGEIDTPSRPPRVTHCGPGLRLSHGRCVRGEIPPRTRPPMIIFK
jgi:hypothetical protein